MLVAVAFVIVGDIIPSYPGKQVGGAAPLNEGHSFAGAAVLTKEYRQMGIERKRVASRVISMPFFNM